MEDFLRETYAAGVPIVGVCFGHQILAQALGGTVEKFAGGWSVGAADYAMEDGRTETIIGWHQDQVTRRPEGATVIGSSASCKNAMLAYGDRALPVQAHPEFTADFLADLLGARRHVLPAHVARAAEVGLTAPLTSSDYADRIAAFLAKPRA